MSTQIRTYTYNHNRKHVYKPLFFRLASTEERQSFEEFTDRNPLMEIHDEIEGQLRELIKSQHPSIKLKDEDYPDLIQQHLDGTDMHNYGVWVYYPWSNRMVHLLDEAEFVEVRTNRNCYKITKEEQALLSKKSIGIVGLSVGQSIALTIAMERICGELRLADFDTAELSNLNRIRTGLHNLGLKKTVIAAREISEIDPFLKVVIYNDGLTENNIDEFFTQGGRLDLLVEVCDGLNIKVVSRFKARELKIPVVMDTNDRGMLDVERFDLEPERPILHGLAGDLDPQKITHLTNEEKIPYILKMIGAESISTRLKASMLEVEQSINTWPQLASSVTLGGAITTDVCRNIFLDYFHDSGRYYIDIEDIIKDKVPKAADTAGETFNMPAPLTITDLEHVAGKYSILHLTGEEPSQAIAEEKLNGIIEAACLAPSGGNAQPWKFLYRHNRLYVFHDASFSHSLLDYNNLGSYVGFGAMMENIEMKSAVLGLAAKPAIFPLEDDMRLIAVVSFTETDQSHTFQHLAGFIGTRMTNRNIAERKLLGQEDCLAMKSITATIPGAELQLFDQEDQLKEFAEILTNTERIRFMHPQGHYDTFVNELRFPGEKMESPVDGLDINTLNLKQGDMAALKIAKDPKAIAFLHRLKKGSGFKKISVKNILTASSIGVITMNGHTSTDYLQGGRALERIWLEANRRNISLQPVSQIIFMCEILLAGGNDYFNDYEQRELREIHERFQNLIQLNNGRFPVFVFRFCIADQPSVRSLRKPIDEVFFK